MSKQLLTAMLPLWLGLCCVHDATAVPVADAPRLTILTEHAPPASMLEEGRVTGFATDKVREILRRSDIAYQIELMPWKRAYTSALQRAGTCVYSTSRTPERERLFKWVGPTDVGEWILMGRAGDAPALRTLEDARALRIGTYNGDVRDDYLRARGFLVDPAPNDMLNPRKLLAGRIDLWAAGMRRGSTVLERHGWADKIVPILVIKKIKVYLACNPEVPTLLIERMNHAADSMERDGTARRIEHKYEQWTEAVAAPSR